MANQSGNGRAPAAIQIADTRAGTKRCSWADALAEFVGPWSLPPITTILFFMPAGNLHSDDEQGGP